MHNLDPDHLSILLIEDNPGDRRLAEIALREAAADADIRCSLAAVGTLAEGLSQLGEPGNHFDAVLLDLGLPDAIGLDGLCAARASSPDVPIVVLTGLSDLATATEALKFGASDYLDKAEVQPRPLLRAIRYAIERKKSESELIRLSRTDPLTGLLNRRAFFDKLDRARLHARRSGLACAVMIIDIDGFKEINDLFGHNTGDEFLVAIAGGLATTIRETDCVARVGGDEFAVLVTHLESASGAIEVAEKIVTMVKAVSDQKGCRFNASASIGIAVYPMDDSEADVLIAHADMAMYKSKTQKKGSISFFDAEMDADVKQHHALKRRMTSDIAESRFFLHFQPIVDTQTGKIIAAEALARWCDEKGEFISPAKFIPVAEDAGLIAQLGAQLTEATCRSILDWQQAGLPVVPISLNVSPIQCRDPTFGLRFVAMIETFGISPDLINLEITESSIIKDLERARKNLDFLKDLGIGIHIDDFGTGYSSLSLLRDLPLDVLKIDRSFVSGLGAEGGSEPIVHAVVDLARKLGLKTIAEGVETEEQVKMLARLGADCLQGYYFSRPLAADAFATLLGEHASEALVA